MKVEQIMTRRVAACSPEEPMRHAAGIFWDFDCGCAPVVDDDGHVIGMITDRDVCMAAYAQGLPLDRMPIESAMTREVFTCRPTDSVAEAETLMRAKQVRRLPVVDDEGRLVGILSLNDIAREATRERDGARSDVTDVEVAQTLAGVGTARGAAHPLVTV